MRHRWIYIDGEAVKLEDRKYEPAAPIVMPDIKPYRSMITGEEIGSRSTHREHLRAHGCVEVGNDPLALNPQYRPLSSPPGLKEKVIRAVNQIEDRDRRG